MPTSDKLSPFSPSCPPQGLYPGLHRCPDKVVLEPDDSPTWEMKAFTLSYVNIVDLICSEPTDYDGAEYRVGVDM